MKTAKEANIEYEIDGNMICCHLSDFINLQESPAGFGKTGSLALGELIKHIQLDAMKEGMRRAAKMCNDQWQQMEVPAERLQIYYAEKGILSVAEQLTEKDLV